MVVAGAEMVSRKAVAHTLERLADTGARILGVVLNRAQIEKHSYYYSHYYGHYYGHYYASRASEGRARRGQASARRREGGEDRRQAGSGLSTRSPARRRAVFPVPTSTKYRRNGAVLYS